MRVSNIKLPAFNPQKKYPDWVTVASIAASFEFPGVALIGFIRLILIEYVNTDVTGIDSTIFIIGITSIINARNAIALLMAIIFLIILLIYTLRPTHLINIITLKVGSVSNSAYVFA